MKISEMTVEMVASYLRLDYDDMSEVERAEIETLINVARKYIYSYTGLDEEEADRHEDFAIVVYILCQDMYDNRSMYVDKNNLNNVVENILFMHSVNLVGGSNESK